MGFELPVLLAAGPRQIPRIVLGSDDDLAGGLPFNEGSHLDGERRVTTDVRPGERTLSPSPGIGGLI